MNRDRWAAHVTVEHPGVATPAVVGAARRVHSIARLLHRATLDGVENLPPTGPFLLVANHSGGLGIAEILTFIVMYLNAVGPDRPLAGFAHPFGFQAWPLSTLLPSIGAIPSTYAAGEAALVAGVPVLIFPGGDHEAMRPVWQAYRVDFGGRVGFLKLARTAWVPVVPLGIRGSALTAPVLWRSRLLAYLFIGPRLIGAKRWALTLLAVLGAAAVLAFVPLAWPWRLLIAWLWMMSPLTMLPCIPWRIRMRIGAPISPETLFGARDAGDQVLPAALGRVESAVQQLVR